MTDELEISRRRLPHWNLSGYVYLVTWSLADGINPLTEQERDLVASALEHFQDDRYHLFAFVVMDDHIHVVVRPLGQYNLGQIVHSWKSYTGNRINELRKCSGALWQADRFDRIIRDEKELHQKLEYVVRNPQRRWPEINEYNWVKWFDWESK